MTTTSNNHSTGTGDRAGRFLPEPTDAGNAYRLVRRHGRDLRWCPALGWFVWDGRRWKRDSAMQIMELAKDTARSIYGEAQRVTDPDKAKKLAGWAYRSQDRYRLEAMVALARSEPGVYVDADDLDSDPWLLNCQNGTLDLTTGTLRQHLREDLLTKIVPVDYRPDARCPRWDGFLRRVFDNHEPLIDYVCRAVGYSLTGDTSERVLFLLHGTGRNGKSTLLEAVHYVLGDYARSTPTQTLMTRRADSIPNDVAALKGARFVSASESEEGKRLAVSQIKDLTGRDTVSARFMRAEWFSFRPSFKLWLATNHKPVAPATDQALWDRLQLIPFAVRIPDSETDKQFGDKLEREAEGILAWAVRGCRAWLSDKTLGSPPEVTEATAAYRSEMDRLGEFIAERCVVRREARVRMSALYNAYLEWCRELAEQPIESRPFRVNLANRGFRRDRSTGGVYYWFGIGLAAEPSGAVESGGPRVPSRPMPRPPWPKPKTGPLRSTRPLPHIGGSWPRTTRRGYGSIRRLTRATPVVATRLP